MTDLHSHLSRIGLAQYTNVFSEEGFESWEILLEITESDLDALGIKLGHRRILQREIAHAKGLSVEQLNYRNTHDGRSVQPEDYKIANKANANVGKRKYRRHPKPDENAPEKPPSAYVIFSNKIRGELKPENLSFTAIAKRVGERWQDLPIEEKEPFETDASTAKARYHAEMAEYKTTKSYREYQQYLNEFKAKNSSTGDAKRPKFDQEESTASNGSQGPDGAESLPSSTDSRERRFDSMGSTSHVASELTSPASVTSGPSTYRGSMPSLAALGNASPLSATSPLNNPITGDVLGGNSLQRTNLGWSNRDVLPERCTSSSTGQHLNRAPKAGKRAQSHEATDASWPGAPMASNFAHPRNEPFEMAHIPNRNPSNVHQRHSDASSKSSGVSSLSNAAVSLPPLSTVTMGSSEHRAPIYATHRAPEASTNRPGHAFNTQRPSSSPFSLASSTAIPRNVTIPHAPSFTPQDSTSSSAIPSNSPKPPKPQLTSQRPDLPALPHRLSNDAQDNVLQPNADPLSVLAYAGRLVGRESNHRHSRQHSEQERSPS